MTATWRTSVNQSVGAERIGDISTYIRGEDRNKNSPIDDFYLETRLALSAFSSAVANSNGNDWTGPLQVIAIVSSTENYFRDLFSRILKMCPDTQKNAASTTVNLGSVMWHTKENISIGAFEHLSFANTETIVSTTNKYVGIDLRKNLKAILDEFDTVCELRHGIVHSGRVLAGKNGIKLKLPPSVKAAKIAIGFAELQEIAAICTTLVVAYNQLMFEEMCRRWATSWRKASGWCPSKENDYFKEIWSIFFSATDHNNKVIPTSGTWIKCRNAIKKEFNLL